jgi:hypothetical protein
MCVFVAHCSSLGKDHKTRGHAEPQRPHEQQSKGSKGAGTVLSSSLAEVVRRRIAKMVRWAWAAVADMRCWRLAAV